MWPDCCTCAHWSCDPTVVHTCTDHVTRLLYMRALIMWPDCCTYMHWSCDPTVVHACTDHVTRLLYIHALIMWPDCCTCMHWSCDPTIVHACMCAGSVGCFVVWGTAEWRCHPCQQESMVRSRINHSNNVIADNNYWWFSWGKFFLWFAYQNRFFYDAGAYLTSVASSLVHNMTLELM